MVDAVNRLPSEHMVSFTHWAIAKFGAPGLLWLMDGPYAHSNALALFTAYVQFSIYERDEHEHIYAFSSSDIVQAYAKSRFGVICVESLVQYVRTAGTLANL